MISRKIATGALVLAAALSMVTPAGQARDMPINDAKSMSGVYHCWQDRTVCLYADAYFKGNSQTISGFDHYTDLSPFLHDQTSSWMNMNYSTRVYLGEWQGTIWNPKYKVIRGAYLDPQMAGTNLQDDAFNDRSDFLAREDWPGLW